MLRGAKNKRASKKMTLRSFFGIILTMNRLRKIIATLALIALFPWDAALALPDIPEVPNCDFNGDVRAIEVMPDGTMYVGGIFTTVTCDGGVTNYTPSRIAKILPDGQFDPTWDNKGVNGPVLALETDGTRLYVGGAFTEAIGNPVNYGYNNIAALELATGYADTSFMEEDIGAGTDGPVYTIINNTYDGSGIIIGGDFLTVSDSFVNLAHSGIGFLAGDGLVVQSYGNLSLMNAGGYANALALDGSTLYIGGAFDTVTWTVGSVIRNSIAAVDLALDASADPAFVISTFNPDLNAEVRAIAIDTANARVFLGGDFTLAKINTTPTVTNYLHPFYAATGEPDLIYGVWPDVSVTDLDLDNGELFVSGNFNNFFGSARNYIASLDVSDIAVYLNAWDPSPDSDVHVVEVTGNNGAMGGNFNSTDGATTLNFARFETPLAPTTSISGTVFEDVNFGLNAGRNKFNAYANGGIPVMGARVEFYDANTLNYLGFINTNPLGDYTWIAPSAGDYIVRVVDASVLSGRPINMGASGLLPVTTFVTDAGVDVTNRVGGAYPNFADHAANNGSETFADLTAGGEAPQTYGLVNASGAMTGVDFGYNFNLVVNVNDSGRGSLRSAITNANALANTGLAQNGYAGGTENIIFRISNGTGSLGMDPGNDNFNPVQSAAIIVLASDLPTINDSLRLDASTQPSLPANTSTPIVLDSSGYAHGFQFVDAENYVRGFVFINSTTDALVFSDGMNEITQNTFGALPDGTITPQTTYPILFNNDAAGYANTIGSNGEPNVFASVGNTAIYFQGSADNSVIQSNYFGVLPDGITLGYCYDAIDFGTGAIDAQIGGPNPGDGNIFANCQNTSIRQWSSSNDIERLVIQGNTFGSDITGMVALNSINPIYLNRTVDLMLGGNTGSDGNLFVYLQNPIYIENATGTKVYGNDFGIYADGVSAAPNSAYRAIRFNYSTTDTEIGDGTVDGTNVFAGGIGGVEFTDYGFTNHYNVRLKGNKIGVDRTGQIAFPVINGFSLNRINGLVIGGKNPGEGNQYTSDNTVIFSIGEVASFEFYGNNCNGNAEISAPFNVSETECLSIDRADGAIIGAPGLARNYFNGESLGLNIRRSEQVTVQNNFFNLNASGSEPMLSHALRGISISESTNTLIGGINPGEPNYFGPHHGSLALGDLGMAIDIQPTNGVWIQGNIIGSDATGTKPFESDFGIGIAGVGNATQNIVIGGSTPAHANTIFAGMGILLYGNDATGAIIQGNSFGVNTAGVATSSGAELTPLPFTVLKPTGIGLIWGAHDNVIEGNVIGGTPSYNGGSGPGIYIAQDTNSPFGIANVPSQNRISRNSFRTNAGLSIDIEDSSISIGGDGVTPNDGIIDPSRAQNGLDYPIITSSTLVGGNLYVEGFVGSGYGLLDFADVEVEIYEQVDDGNQNGEVVNGDGLSLPHGEGYLYLGTVMTDSGGGNFSGVVPAPFLASATDITALAIDQYGNTSEFGTYFNGVIPPPAPPVIVSVQNGNGGLSCNMMDPKNPGNGCQTLGQLPIFGLTTSSLPQISIVPDVPMPWLNGTTSTVSVPAVCKPLINKYLRFGSKNDAEQVKLLQRFLKEKDGSYKGVVNGVFDKATDTAVRAFQKKYAKDVLEPWGHKSPTGYVYITTSRKINALNCQR